MKDVSNLSVRQFRIFEQPVVPLDVLSTQGAAKILNEIGFAGVGIAEESGDLILSGLLYKFEESKEAISATAHLSPRRIIVGVGGDSDTACRFYDFVVNLVEQFRKGSLKDLAPIIVTEETECQVTLDFDWRSLVSDNLGSFLDELVDSVSSDAIRAELLAGVFGAVLGFHAADDNLEKHGVVLAKKAFRVEPLKDTPALSRRFLTSSPTDSDTHFRLLKSLEASLSGSSISGES